MAAKRFQNIIAENRLLLPFTSVITLLVFFLSGSIEKQSWLPLSFLALSTYLISELNNIHSLIRVYSRMVSSSFLMLSSAACFLFSDFRPGLIQLCLIAFYMALFQCYQVRHASKRVYFGFLCIGIVSTIFVQILYFVPFFWLIMTFNLRTFYAKSFFASLLGLITPYWFGSIYLFTTGEIGMLLNHFEGIATFMLPFNIMSLSLPQLLTLAYVFVLAFIGTIHFIRKKYQDKIRIRMLYRTFITINILTFALLIVQPQHYSLLLPMLIVNTSPLIAHFITLTRTRQTNIVSLLIFLLNFILIGYNLWILS